MVSVLVEAIKDQQNIINSLSARLDKLEAPIVEEVVAVEEVKPKAKKAKEPKEPKAPKEKKAKKSKGEEVV